MIEVPDVGSWVIVAFAFLVLPLASRPAVQRVAVALAERTDEWSKARAAVRDRMDPEQEKLWLWTKRRRLCAAIARIEQLIATDDWMSATRQLGNRLAYEQLLDELRRTPDVFPASLDAPVVDYWAQPLSERARSRRTRAGRDDSWDESSFSTGWSVATPTGFSAQPGEVEFLDIGRRRREN